MKTDVLTDSALVLLAAEGSEKAFTELLQRHRMTVYKSILAKIPDRDLADDLYQDVWIKVMFLLREGKYRDEGRFGGWLTRVTQNAVVDYFRRQKQFSTVSLDDNYSVGVDRQDDGLNWEEVAVDAAAKEEVLLWMKKLPKEQYEVVYLRMYAGLSFQEIAEETNVSINTALGRMRYALINLRKMMQAAA